MRIVSGKYRSRIIKAPENNLTRPTSDIVRESLFNVINGKCINANCIDIFAGSGALGIEALSRGAKKCVFIDNNYLAIKTINENLNSLKEQNYKIYKADYHIIKKLNEKFDIIFLDHHYKLKVFSLIFDLIIKKDLLNCNGLIIYESDKTGALDDNFEGFEFKKYIYRDTVINILKKID